MPRPENQQAQGGNDKTYEGRLVIAHALPLADEDGDEKGGEDEVQTLGIDGNVAADDGAEGGACYPVQLVQNINEGHKPALVDAFGDIRADVNGKGFVAHTEDEVEFFETGVLIFFQHGDAVE